MAIWKLTDYNPKSAKKNNEEAGLKTVLYDFQLLFAPVRQLADEVAENQSLFRAGAKLIFSVW